QELLDAKVRQAKEARIQEENKLQALKKKRQDEELKRKDEELKRKEKVATEKKQLLELKKKREVAELKRKEEEKRLAELEKKRKQEEERVRQEEQAKQEVEMKRKLEAERQAREAASRQVNQSEIKRFQGLIKREVTRRWIVPNLNVKNLSCDVKVRIIPSGDVIDVKIIKSSGNQAFDRSVEAAVYKAAPLPVPTVESGLFEEFREVIFSFDPKNVAELGN
ncbi:MAG: cell envelope integrity protein TolA, partial [Gammaproteobacteria bacterium]|nr:cell envelope integrity protein TolA [Gammaproteobacteria bacterium]